MGKSKQIRVDIRLVADTVAQYHTEGGQRSTVTLPRGTILTIPASWIYQTEQIPTNESDLLPADTI